jgi:TRAP-type C4-dicarboxylate transport system permease large subunit
VRCAQAFVGWLPGGLALVTLRASGAPVRSALAHRFKPCDDPHSGIMFLTNLEIGYAASLVGLHLFLSSLRFECPIAPLYRASWPFLFVLGAALLPMTSMPALGLALLKWFGYAGLPLVPR